MTPLAEPATTALDRIRAAVGTRYHLERELGRGGMGSVYLARDLRLDRPVALKVLPPEFAEQTGLRERFLLETRTAARFSHPNIVPVYAVEESSDVLAYAMGFIEGETLTQRVQRAGPLPTREIVRLLQDAAYALAYAHGRGVVHRDIKPDNVMLERATGRALVMDFGISRSIVKTQPMAALTRVGEVVGTPEYMSPEQAAGDHVDGRSDLYSLGLTAHFAATGRVAVTGETPPKILVKQLTEPIPPISESRAGLPQTLAAAIDRCVKKDPAERFSTAEELIEAIDAGQLSEPDIPLPIRLFAGDLGTLSLIAVGIALFTYFVVQAAEQQQLGSLDTILPVILLFSILVTRSLTTFSEARRLAVAGFGADEVMAGLSRVVEERARRRAELRADPAVRRRRRSTIAWGAGMLVVAAAMIWFGMGMRTMVAPRRYAVPPGAVVLVVSAIAMIGIALVLLMQSPFRMPPGERLFRLAWLGPAGRAFVRLAGRRVRPMSSSRGPRISSGAVGAVGPAESGTPSTSRLDKLEARLAELERQQQERPR
jgi:serine/threonine-protein kinase